MNALLTQLTELTTLSAIVRVALATLLGILLGWERSRSGHNAGARTYAIVCVASCLATMTGMYLSTAYDADASRIAAQVISGVGFLGAGIILWRNKTTLSGLTTAAGLWAAACLGLAIGAGFYAGAIAGFAAIFLLMIAFPRRRSQKEAEEEEQE